MLDIEQVRLIVNLDDLRDYDRSYADGLLLQPMDYLPAFNAALLQLVQVLHDPVKHKIATNECEWGAVSFELCSLGRLCRSSRLVRPAAL